MCLFMEKGEKVSHSAEKCEILKFTHYKETRKKQPNSYQELTEKKSLFSAKSLTLSLLFNKISELEKLKYFIAVNNQRIVQNQTITY